MFHCRIIVICGNYKDFTHLQTFRKSYYMCSFTSEKYIKIQAPVGFNYQAVGFDKNLKCKDRLTTSLILFLNYCTCRLTYYMYYNTRVHKHEKYHWNKNEQFLSLITCSLNYYMYMYYNTGKWILQWKYKWTYHNWQVPVNM